MSSLQSIESQTSATRRLLFADLSLLSVAVIWGVNIPVMKVALEQNISPYSLNAIRLVVSAIVLLGFARYEYSLGVRPTGALSRWRVFIYAMVVSVAYQFLFLMAVSKTTSADIALIMATVPMWTALAARYFLKEIIPALAWAGLIVAFIGTMIVTLQRESQTLPAKEDNDAAVVTQAAGEVQAAISTQGEGETNGKVEPAGKIRSAGNLLALLAALTWAGGTVFSRPLLKTISPTQLAACAATISLPFHMLIAWSTLGASLPLLKSVPLQLCILYSGILSTGLALAMWSYGVKHAGAAQATMFQNLTPIIAIGAAWVWRGETVSVAQTIGGVMIIGGLIVMRHSRKTADAVKQES